MQYSIGIDIGGTNSCLGLVDQNGAIIAQRKIKTQQFPVFQEYIQALAAEINELKDEMQQHDTNAELQGIGIGAPNANYYTGCIEFAPNLPWKHNIPLAKSLQQATALNVTITNDANAAAIGEMRYGAARGMKHFIELTLGTGVGTGIIVDGRLLYGSDGFAGELGHVIVDRSQHARQCGCGRRGCLETYCSATGMARTARILLAERSDDSLLRQIPSTADITSLDIYQAAKQGDAIALEVFEYTGRILGQAIADFVVFSAPEAIILFGGPTAAGSLLLDPIRRHMEENMLSIWKNKVKLMLSTLDGSNAAILGAAALVQ